MTRRQLQVLKMMRDGDFELVYEHGLCYVENERISKGTFIVLLAACALRHDPYSAGPDEGLEIYSINETGKNILKEAGW